MGLLESLFFCYAASTLKNLATPALYIINNCCSRERRRSPSRDRYGRRHESSHRRSDRRDRRRHSSHNEDKYKGSFSEGMKVAEVKQSDSEVQDFAIYFDTNQVLLKLMTEFHHVLTGLVYPT